MTVNWLGKYSFLTPARTAPSVRALKGIGSRRNQRWMKPSAPGALVGVAGLVRVGAGPRAAAGAAGAGAAPRPCPVAAGVAGGGRERKRPKARHPCNVD